MDTTPRLEGTTLDDSYSYSCVKCEGLIFHKTRLTARSITSLLYVKRSEKIELILRSCFTVLKHKLKIFAF